MNKLPLRKEHLIKLEEYGLQNISFDACQCLRFKPGEAITKEGELISRFAFVTSGRAKACRTASNGNVLILSSFISDGMIGEIELLTGQIIAITTVTAITDFECVAIPYQTCMTELKTNVQFLYRLGVVLAEKLAASSDSLAQSALCTGEQRLCSYILQTSNHEVFSDILTDVSCSIGMSYRHMFRLLNQLCDNNILEKRNSGYVILDRNKLIQRSCIEDDLMQKL